MQQDDTIAKVYLCTSLRRTPVKLLTFAGSSWLKLNASWMSRLTFGPVGSCSYFDDVVILFCGNMVCGNGLQHLEHIDGLENECADHVHSATMILLLAFVPFCTDRGLIALIMYEQQQIQLQ